jgi:hypothetical protein
MGNQKKKDRQYNGQKIPNGKSEAVCRKRIDNTMAKRYPMGNQRPYIKRIDNAKAKRYPMATGNQRPYIEKG